ncbi:hypothetical protein EMCRGX_G029733 [Ephydatia muelleri]
MGTHNYTRPADVLVDGWDRAKPAAFDVTVTSPLTPVTLNEASINEGAAALAAETRKHAANDAMCQALGWSCIPLAVETFGNWGREAQGVFSRLATLLALHQGRSKSTVVRDIYGHLSISLVSPTDHTLFPTQIFTTRSSPTQTSSLRTFSLPAPITMFITTKGSLFLGSHNSLK